MNNKNNGVMGILVAGILLIILYFLYMAIFSKTTTTVVTDTQVVVATTTNISYTNLDYGFSLNLSKDWENFTATESEIQFGNLVTIRKSVWGLSSPTADIPILIYPIEQWKIWEGNDFEGYPTAAPMGPTERGRNAKYIFATAPRYNFSFNLGFEEVEEIIKNLKVF